MYLVHAERLTDDQFTELLCFLKGSAHTAAPMGRTRTIRVSMNHNQTPESLIPYFPLLS